MGRTAWLGLILVTAASGLACLGRMHWLLAILEHFRAQYVVVALLLLLGLLVISRWRPAFVLVALALSLFNASFLVPYFLDQRAQAPLGAESVSVLLWNTWRKNRDHERVNQAIRDSGADVVLLQETTEDVRSHLTELDDVYRVFTSGDEAALTRSALPCQVYRVKEEGFRALHLEILVGTRALDLIATHLAVPLSARAAGQRTAQLAVLADWVNLRTSPVVVLGDLNATPWGHELQDLRSRCRLKDSLVGCGLQPTWPFHNVFTSLLRIPLDHCLTTAGVVAFDRSVGDPEGSNHRPVLVRLALADG